MLLCEWQRFRLPFLAARAIPSYPAHYSAQTLTKSQHDIALNYAFTLAAIACSPPWPLAVPQAKPAVDFYCGLTLIC